MKSSALTDIGKSYYIGKQEVPVLTKIDLSIFKGEFVSIMGPSGAGNRPHEHSGLS